MERMRSLLPRSQTHAAQSLLDQYATGNQALAARIAQCGEDQILAEARRLAPLASDLLLSVKPLIGEGITGLAIQDHLLAQYQALGWRPMLVGYKGYPAAVPVSVNRRVINCIPDEKPVPAAALVTVELVAATAQGYVAQAWTFATADANVPQQHLLASARHALQQGIEQVRDGVPVGAIGEAIGQVLEACEVSPVVEFCGYTMGKHRVQAPQILGYRAAGQDTPLQAGQVLNVYVVAKAGERGVRVLSDAWTVLSKDGQDSVVLSAMVEVTADGYQLLTPLLR
ncbi:MAG: M24 family metallopeptidase [Pseudomonas sp.]|uniref:M24 family metallopeptidase n=1 Tax=Pseudomonas abieticivorans TaxID=2931382 RepID=UPI0020BE76D0|nr:M24 family metallopeptidase [Pseudomonas sp. PIA16]MDE1169403.1 M24 family metallopeptidase [Pseudomonas sp.]